MQERHKLQVFIVASFFRHVLPSCLSVIILYIHLHLNTETQVYVYVENTYTYILFYLLKSVTKSPVI